MASTSPVTAVILAAGAGSRMGGVAKALLPGAADPTFLAAIARVLAEVGVAPARTVVVVAPPFAAAVAAEAARLGLGVVENQAGADMSSSVAVGFAAIAGDVRCADSDVALLWPVDHARVGAAAVRAVLAAAGDAAAVPTWQDRGGHPVAVARRLWPALAAVSGAPGGARDVLRPVAVRVAVDDPGVVADVDTWADVEVRP
jgi:molybdenum cofactor cytidylyltransferase